MGCIYCRRECEERGRGGVEEGLAEQVDGEREPRARTARLPAPQHTVGILVTTFRIAEERVQVQLCKSTHSLSASAARSARQLKGPNTQSMATSGVRSRSR